jgi:HD-like signal output (HDOD) protein
MQRRVLFVDDEPNVLNGLRRMLRPMRDEWATDFAEGGPQALAKLEKERFDIVVSDMRMPGMSGDQLLEEVRVRHPHMVRIVLTGQCDKESGLRAFRVAHRMLNKPCDPEILKRTIGNACALQALVSDAAVRKLITGKDSIPSLPSLFLEILAELDKDEASVPKLAAMISRDITMLAKMLQVANSSFYGARTDVTSPAHLITMLGLNSMRHLVLAVGIFSAFKMSQFGPVSIEAIWEHSQKAAALAKTIARAAGKELALVENAGTAGMLHDVGKLVFLDSTPQAYLRALQTAQATGQPEWVAERAALGANHAEVGGCLLQLWGLPTSIVEAVAWHHGPSKCAMPEFTPLTAVHVADGLLATRAGEADRFDHAYLARLGLEDRLPAWEALMETTIKEPQPC